VNPGPAERPCHPCLQYLHKSHFLLGLETAEVKAPRSGRDIGLPSIRFDVQDRSYLTKLEYQLN
jgi:hypothetical protein